MLFHSLCVLWRKTRFSGATHLNSLLLTIYPGKGRLCGNGWVKVKQSELSHLVVHGGNGQKEDEAGGWMSGDGVRKEKKNKVKVLKWATWLNEIFLQVLFAPEWFCQSKHLLSKICNRIKSLRRSGFYYSFTSRENFLSEKGVVFVVWLSKILLILSGLVLHLINPSPSDLSLSLLLPALRRN